MLICQLPELLHNSTDGGGGGGKGRGREEGERRRGGEGPEERFGTRNTTNTVFSLYIGEYIRTYKPSGPHSSTTLPIIRPVGHFAIAEVHQIHLHPGSNRSLYINTYEK